MNSFHDVEQQCSYLFSGAGKTWHLWTPEDHELVFASDGEFQSAMTIVAVCARFSTGIRIVTFILMSNHIHFVIIGEMEEVQAFFNLLKKLIRRQLGSMGRPSKMAGFECHLRLLSDIEDARNVIAYDNRNGFLVNPQTTPFSYPWGANRYYFNEDAQLRFLSSRRPITVRRIREVAHGKIADHIKDLFELDGYACPMSFCDIPFGEKLFRNASHYFSAISRNTAAYKTIAKETRERIFYTDDDLFSIVCAMSNESHGVRTPKMLPPEAKIEIAKTMHYDYYANNKQIKRMLGLDWQLLNSLFPTVTQ